MDDNNIDPVPPTRTSAPPRFGGLSRRAATGITALGLVTGGLAGGFIVSHAATSSSSSSSATNSTGSGSTGSGTSSQAPVPGTFHPNEDPTHEAGESAQREAQEN